MFKLSLIWRNAAKIVVILALFSANIVSAQAQGQRSADRKLPKEFAGKFYTDARSAFVQNEANLRYEITREGVFKYNKDGEMVTGTIKAVQYFRGGLSSSFAAGYLAIQIEIDGKKYEMEYEQYNKNHAVVDDTYPDDMAIKVIPYVNPNDKNITILHVGSKVGNEVLKAGKYFASAKTGVMEEFDERIIAMWYLDKPKSAQWAKDKVAPENKYWDFLIMEEGGKFFYVTPDMMNSSKMGTKNRISNPSEGTLKMGKNEAVYQIEGNKLQVKGAAASGFTMGAQIKSGVYYKYDPSGPEVNDAEVMIEIGKQAVDVFGK